MTHNSVILRCVHRYVGSDGVAAELKEPLGGFVESRSSFHVSFSHTNTLPIRGTDVPSLRSSAGQVARI